MKEDRIIILGAGCAGLAAAWRLRQKGQDVLILEREDHVGGLAGGIVLGGNVYEYGPHIIHTTDPEILADIKDLMGPELVTCPRSVRVKFMGNYFKFPLSIRDVLVKLPLWTVFMAGVSLVFRLTTGFLFKPREENSETILRRYYGDVLYKLFFRDYILRVWGIPASAFSPAFARERIPKMNIMESMQKLTTALRRRMGEASGPLKTSGFVENVSGDLYTTKLGFSMITQKMADRLTAAGGEVSLNSEVLRLEHDGSRVTGVVVKRGGGTETLPCRAVINTLPINEMTRSFQPDLGPEAAEAAKALRYRATVFVGIKVNRTKVLPASFMYFREHAFNRVTDLSWFGQKIEPEGCTLLVAEVNCDPSEKLWNDEPLVKEMVIADLVREDLLRREEILESHLFRSRNAYPLYTLHYEKSLAVLLKRLSAFKNFETTGRQGRFQYVNTHVAMKMGNEAAELLLARLNS